MSKRTTLFVVFVVFVAAVAGIATAADAVSAQNETEPETEPTSTPEPGFGDASGPSDGPSGEASSGGSGPSETDNAPYTLRELESSGPSLGDSPPSVRLEGDQMWWGVYWPASVFAGGEGDPTDPNFQYIDDGTVDRDTVWLRTVNIQQPRTETVTVVAYDVYDYRENETGQQRRVAENITVEQQEVEIGRGWVIESVDIPSSSDEQEVAMWIGDDPDTDLHWTFTHRTTTVSQTTSFDTWGGMLAWIVPWFVAPLVLGSVASLGAAKQVVKRVGTGPGYSTAQWTFLFGIVFFIVGWAYFGELTALAIEHPYAIAAFFVAYVFAVAVDRFDAYTSTVRFIQPTLNAVTSPSGSDAADQLEARERTSVVIDRPDEPAAVATPGLIPFLARLVSGKAATLKTVNAGHSGADQRGEVTTEQDPLQCRIPVSQGSVDEKVLSHPKMEEPIRYEPEGFTLSPPSINGLDDVLPVLVRVGAVVALASGVNMMFGPGLAFVAFAVGIVAAFITAEEGEAAVWLSPLHYRSARATAMHLASELDDADTISEERQKRIEESMDTEKRVMREADQRDQTLIEGLYSFVEGDDEDPTRNSNFGLDGLGRPDDYDAGDDDD